MDMSQALVLSCLTVRDRKKQGQFGSHSCGHCVNGYDIELSVFSSNNHNRVRRLQLFS